MIKTIFFDLDGTLIDSERAFLQADAVAATVLGHNLLPDDFLPLVGTSEATTAAFITAQVGAGQLPAFLRLTREYVDAWLIAGRHVAQPAATETLRTLKARGYPLGVVTSSQLPHLRWALRATGWEGLFTWLFPYSGGAQKPAPDPYLHALAQAGVTAKTTLAVEDTPIGVAAASAAGMPVVQVTDLAPTAPEALAHFHTLAELPAWVGTHSA